MNRHRILCALLAGIVLLGMTASCDPPGVGDPCRPEVRPPPNPDAPGINQPWAYGEVSVETRSLQCRTRTCMVYHYFPTGEDEGEPDWRVCPAGAPAASVSEFRPCAAHCDEPGYPACDPACCNWPYEDSASEPCRTIDTDQFVDHFCKTTFDSGTYSIDRMVPSDHPSWYCNFDMSLVNASRPFCTLKCGGAGRTFECPEGFACREVVTLGPEGMRGSYCVPSKLVDCEPKVQGEQDCCLRERVLNN